MDRMVDVVAELRAAAPGKPIIVQANAGMPVNVDGIDTFPEDPSAMALNTVKVVEAGANIVGGCCGTTPSHIQAIRNAVIRS